MRGRSTHWIYKNLLWIVLVLCTASIASAEWYKDYESALDSIKKGRWADAIPKLQSAISQKDQEGLNIKFYGMKFDDYLPHFYLGKAYFSQNNYQAALREFQISQSQGEIQRNHNYFQNLTELQTLAKAQLGPGNPPAVAEKPAQTPQESKPAPPVEKKTEPQVAVRINPEQPKQSPEVAPKQQPPEPTISPEDLNREKTKALVKEGARRYFQGDLDSAIASFSSALAVNPQEFSAQFLLGCSYAAKYLLSGSSDRSSYDKAATAFQQSKKINPNHPLIKSTLISPAVREIYEKSAGA